MKVTLEPTASRETEVIIRGDVAGEEVRALLQFLGRKNNGKLLLYREEEQYIIDPGELVFLEVRDGRVYAFTKQDTYEARLKLYEVKELLSTCAFAQISKSVIVNIDFVKSIQAEFSGNYRIKLKGRKEVLTVSRKYFKEFKDKI